MRKNSISQVAQKSPHREICITVPKLIETFEKCSILAKVKEGENFNHRNIWNISRIEI
jgi:hypothetical protein